MQGFSDTEREASANSPASPPAISVEEAARLASIEESRRKLRDLEADRPLWEAAARQREAREAALAAEASAKSRARKAEEEEARIRDEDLRQQNANAARWDRREEQTRGANEWAAHARQARERRSRMEKWTTGLWTESRAFARYLEECTFFDATQFSAVHHPLTADDVPWPTLSQPDMIPLSTIEWSSVELFFQQLGEAVTQQEYYQLLESSHRRFHPDRWSSRGLFDAVLDPQERQLIERGVC